MIAIYFWTLSGRKLYECDRLNGERVEKQKRRNLRIRKDVSEIDKVINYMKI